MILDNHGVDGVVNGIADTSGHISNVVRAPQTGRIRNYVLVAAGAAAVMIIVVLFVASRAAAATSVVIVPGP